MNDVYRKQRGSSLKISLEFSLISSLAGLIVLLAVNGFKIEFTWFTFAIAMLAVGVSIGSAFCGFKALGTINLSLYSIFMMLGGMVLPFIQGILFYGEGITVAKIICFVLITVALLLTVEPKKDRKKSTIYYVGIFILNGMSGVLSKIFTAAPYPKTSAAGYSILLALSTAVVSAIILLLFFKNKDRTQPMTVKSLSVCALNGAVNKVANFLLVLALIHVDASIQYPMVTGGVMIVSTLICFFGKNKPKPKELLSIAIIFVGMLALLLPI